MFQLDIAFPGGRYSAAQSDNQSCPEWPPHPSRVYSALVAAAGARGMTPEDQVALHWLEQQEPPVIDAPPADLRHAPTSFVPPGGFNAQAGKNEHPVFRIRKDRYFPTAMILGNPLVRYLWVTDPDPTVYACLADIAQGVTHVGTSHSMTLVQAGTDNSAAAGNWLPAANGENYLRVPTAGRLEELRLVHGGTLGLRRPPPACEPLVAYRKEAPDGTLPNPVYAEIVRFRLSGVTHDATSTESLGRALRAAVMSRMDDPVPDAVHGHVDGKHVGWLTLVDVREPTSMAGSFARGRVIGFGVGIPQGLNESDRQRLLMALGQVQANGVHIDDGRDLALEIVLPGKPLPLSLQAATWTAASDTWATVTPIVPDRLPKRMREDLIARAVVDSLVRAGFPQPDGVSISQTSFWAGAPNTSGYRMRLPRTHAVVQFPQPVAGPVIAGRLRYFGVGLFRPILAG